MSLGFHEITSADVRPSCANYASPKSPTVGKRMATRITIVSIPPHQIMWPIVYPRAWMVWRTDDGVTLHFIGPSLPFSAERTPSTTTPSHVSWNTNNFACQEVGAIVKRLLCTSWRGFVK